ncbi:MAG: 16S rRNA (cytosine967-C5)-methyltransferase [Hyphomonadaceae bacterium]|nr:MAG: 16S rRNA (cytosine967-C5)-methyltransferase [Hyphomonadaceae bacterium]
MHPKNNNRRNQPNNRRPQKRRCPDDARHAAARLIWLVLEENRTLDEVMASEESYAELSGVNRSFAAAIAKSTLRHLGHIDVLLNGALQKPLPETAFYARSILRTGIAQYLADLAPAYAIIDRAVELAKSNKIAFGMAGLVNAILRKIVTKEQKPELKIEDLLPAVWRSRYQSFYGNEITKLIANELLTHSPIDLTILDGDPVDIQDQFGGEILPNGSLRLASLPEGFTALEAWANGQVIVQNAAASIPAKLLGAKPSENILDMCAAPGGKTMQLAATGAKVTALDLNEDRLRLVAENLARTKLNAKLICGSAQNKAGENCYDAILLDAPCSATGTLKSNLESLWIKSPFDLPKTIQNQEELMRTAAKALKKNGRLVYAVCSLEPEEADLAVAAAIDAGLRLDPIKAEEVSGLEIAIEARGTMRILPHYWSDKGGLDGFFIARFLKL